MIGKVIGIMFLSRDVAHKEHLKSRSYAQHEALGGFYECVITKADQLAEAYQGMGKLIDDIPYMENDREGTPEEILRRHMLMIKKACGGSKKEEEYEGAVGNTLDEIEALYLSTLYKLKFLK